MMMKYTLVSFFIILIESFCCVNFCDTLLAKRSYIVFGKVDIFQNIVLRNLVLVIPFFIILNAISDTRISFALAIVASLLFSIIFFNRLFIQK